jgi:uncharacterized membrane protein YfcA
MDSNTILILLLIGVFAGIVSGMVGIGGGILIVPALIYFLGLNQQQAQGVSLGVFLMPVGLLAAYQYYQNGQLPFKYSLVIAITFVVGAFFGAKIALNVNEMLLKKIFGVFILLISLKLIFGK